ncbi:hypothetical protein BJX68DRAFT_264566 [Aspergillus pseudodeflectus]|uniref:Ribonucleases P/MRP subunit Pop8-like domain-containing protein n=1 Tax=Aspergillus pseudodeflectus TaxID=176178 RepID=A0ABR4KQW0_9EURO
MTPTKRKAASDTQTTTFTARNPPWTYLKLQLIHQHHSNTSTSALQTPLDPLTARTYLSSALSQFLGQMGTSIPIDILKVSPEPPRSQSQSQSTDKTIWIRVPRQDAQAVVTAVSSWIGGAGSDTADAESGVAWRVCAKGNFLGALVRGGGRDLFVS